jgi:hypothetical protein
MDFDFLTLEFGMDGKYEIDFMIPMEAATLFSVGFEMTEDLHVAIFVFPVGSKVSGKIARGYC